MKSDVDKWLKDYGEDFMRNVGISRGQSVLDFGCGSGNYAIPTARIVGDKGVVYALDKDRGALDELMRRARLEGLVNIKRIDTSGEVRIKLDDESVDVVLLYDIFWYFPPSDARLTRLLSEVYRVLKHGGMLSVLPKHTDPDRLRREIEEAGFRLKDRHYGTIIHGGVLEDGWVFNFIKE